ncbi:MAG: hypothetical protein KJ930_08750 [Gammaproteobacteria bacterium]|jgi:hypothetical protein|nr:hypothetical protein [Gammaproteobacteria bacterium]MBU2179509.1 hypothetical protein [Gammaproteobacteria bacterium]MBU2223842.1 hypothetical protein [Gammaproteobacteria bacterium]MBU2280809.1 hypothetical protein [Gammaproteobacteria bacterium]MBU2427082.1 hypothetical protein [Gammaproteobacteria bacterium]
MEQQQMIHQYLNTLQRYLARLSPAEAKEVIREIESHIFDLIEQCEAAGQQADAASILQGFGEPRQLAEQYVAHMTAGAPPPLGFRAIQRVKHGVTAGLYYSMAAFGFLTSFSLLFLAGAKLITPDAVGVWAMSEGNSLTIAFLAEPFPKEQELMGMALVPVAAVLGVLVMWLTRRILTVLKSQL